MNIIYPSERSAFDDCVYCESLLLGHAARRTKTEFS